MPMNMIEAGVARVISLVTTATVIGCVAFAKGEKKEFSMGEKVPTPITTPSFTRDSSYGLETITPIERITATPTATSEPTRRPTATATEVPATAVPTATQEPTRQPTNTEIPATAVPTATQEPTRQPTEVPSPTVTLTPEATEVKETVLIETINVGETAIGNSIDLKIYSQEKDSSGPIIWIMGGIHPGEMTGWSGYLTEASKWLLAHSEEWKGLRFALGDVNPDGYDRYNPNGVNVMRNADFDWHFVPKNEQNKCSPDGASAGSEPETVAIMNAGEILLRMGRVLYVVDFHRWGPTIDPSMRIGGDDDLSIVRSQKLAKEIGFPYEEVYSVYGCQIEGQPDDALARIGIPGGTLEFPQDVSMEAIIDRVMRGLIKVMLE